MQNTAPFTLISTVSPDFEPMAERVFFPTFGNAGAARVVIHRIDAGSWAGNIGARAEIIQQEILNRYYHKERLLFIDADCMVLRDLSGGFSQYHAVSVARWPSPNMGVLYCNLAVEPGAFDASGQTTWPAFMAAVTRDIGRAAKKRRRDPMLECDQPVWRHYLQVIVKRLYRLPEWEYNYSEFDLPVWRRQLPNLQPIMKVLHVKGHGDWKLAKLRDKVAYAKTLWPEELACIEYD